MRREESWRGISRSMALAVYDDYSRGATIPALIALHDLSAKTISRVIRGQHQWTRGMPNISRRSGRPCDHGRRTIGQRRCRHTLAGQVTR